jgi:hypothetical protein
VRFNRLDRFSPRIARHHCPELFVRRTRLSTSWPPMRHTRRLCYCFSFARPVSFCSGGHRNHEVVL